MGYITPAEEAKLKQDFRGLLQLSTEQEFRDAIRALGLRDGSEGFETALRIWREYEPD